MSDMRVPHSTAPLVSIPSGGTAAGQARHYDTNLGAPMQNGTNAVDAFGSSSSWRPLAQGFADVAQVTQAVVQKTLQEEAETRAADAYAKFGAELNEYVDNDILSRKGQNAFGAVGDVAKFAEDTEARLSKGMNDATRKIFSARAAQFRFGVQSQVAAHEGGERRQARFDSKKSSAALEFDLAMKNSGDERLFAEGKARGLQYVGEMSDMAGHDEKTKALYLQKAAGEYDAGRIARFVEAGNYDRAFAVWETSDMPAEQKAGIAREIGRARFEAMEAEARRAPLSVRNNIRKKRHESAADFAAQKESGNNPGAVGYDQKGGTSYGAWQISSANMPAFITHLEDNAPELASRLRAAGQADTAGKGGTMPAVWKQITAEDPEGFRELQQGFIEKQHINPVLRSMPLDMREAFESNPVLAKALYSTAVQHGTGNAPALLTSAWAKSGGDLQKYISLLYADRKTRFNGSTAEVRNSVIRRLEKEETELLAELSGGHGAVAPRSVDDLIGQAGWWRLETIAETELKQQAGVLLRGADDAFSHGRRTGDYSHTENLIQRLADLGQDEAALELRESCDLYREAEPFLRPSQNEPLLARAQNAQNALEARRTPGNSATVDRLRQASTGDMNQEIARFSQDPAGYVAGNPLLQDAGLTPEAKIKASFELQRRVGAGLDVDPRVLTAPQAAEWKQRYETATDYGEKAKVGFALFKTYGMYAGAAATEAGLPAALVGIAQVTPSLSPGDATKLVVAAQTEEKDLPQLSDHEWKKRRGAALDGPYVKTLATIRQVSFASREQARFCSDMADTLVKYSLMGNSIDDFESKFLIVNDGDMAIIAPRGTPFHESALRAQKNALINSLESADFAAMFRGTPLEGAIGSLHTRFIKENYRSMYDNGVWMYDPQEEGYVLWDKASGRAAPNLDGSPVIVRAAHMNMPKVEKPGPKDLSLYWRDR